MSESTERVFTQTGCCARTGFVRQLLGFSIDAKDVPVRIELRMQDSGPRLGVECGVVLASVLATVLGIERNLAEAEGDSRSGNGISDERGAVSCDALRLGDLEAELAGGRVSAEGDSAVPAGVAEGRTFPESPDGVATFLSTVAR